MTTKILCLAVTCVTLAAAAPAHAQGKEYCFQLSLDGKAWSRTPELLCVAPATGQEHVITLRTGLKRDEVARFNFALLSRARCIDCNRDVFGPAGPANSVFNTLKIVFDGKRDANKPSNESGTVSIGKTTLFYRTAK
ncbi:MAG TPA: hypothetical protein VGQ83_21090 [Polyangia bacterium]|jgi:hypothetical protein